MDEQKMVPRKPTEGVMPCPFCSGTKGLAMAEELIPEAGGGWRVICYGCQVKTFSFFSSRNEAVAMWNMRAAPPAPAPDDVIKSAVDRFLCWQLPRGFAPDCGIAFDGRKDDEWNKNKTWPVGTNLLTAEQAREMFTHCLADAISALVAERDMWMTRCAGLMSMLPPETTCGDVRRAALAQKEQRNG